MELNREINNYNSTMEKHVRHTRDDLTVTEKDNGKENSAPHFQTTFGLVLSCMGCVVGTGNIWRFPRIVANNSEEEGGLVFILVWVLFLFLWSSPLLVLEYGTGRYTKKAVVGSFQQLVGNNSLWCGAWISMVTFFISCFYSVVLGWCFYYLYYYIRYSLPANEVESRETFRDYAEDSKWPILTHFLAVLLAGISVAKGVKTIEKVSMVLVPLLLLIIIFTFVWSLTREYADYGIKFLFSPKWDSFGKPRLWVDALSQNAFDTGAGMGLMIPYSSYMTKNNGIVKYGHLIPATNNLIRVTPLSQNAFDTGAGMGLMIPYSSYMTKNNGIVKYGHLIPATNNLISLICGITVFGTVFSTLILTRGTYTRAKIVDIMKDSGPASTGLTFIWMPVLFSTVGSFGRVLAILFFLCLSFAGVTSLMSNFELMTHTFQDFGLPRKFGMPLTVVLTFSVGLMSALDIDILTNQDFVWGFALVINGLMLMYMVLRFGVTKFRQVCVNQYGSNDWQLTRVWEIVIRFLAPIEAVAIIGWWAYDLISDDSGDGEDWYAFGRETLVMTLTQWVGVLLLLILCNIVFVVLVDKIRRHPTPEEQAPLLQTDKYVGDGGQSFEQARDLDGSVKELRL